MAGGRARSREGSGESGGADLFKELFRHYPLAKVEDYFKDGRWNIQRLEVDTELLIVHRREAGADEPQPLEELDLPELPREREGRLAPAPPGGPPPPRMRSAPPRTPPLSLASSEKGRALAPSGVSSARPRTPPRGAPLRRGPSSDTSARRPAPAPPSDPPRSRRDPGAAAPATAKEKLEDFIARFRLDSKRTKLVLLKLTPPQLRDVYASFQPTGDPDAALERYIEKHTKNGTSTSSQKRPLNGSVSSSEGSAAKRPRTDPPPTSSRSAVGARPSSAGLPSKPKTAPPRNLQRNGDTRGASDGAKDSRSSTSAASSSHEPGDLIRSLLGSK